MPEITRRDFLKLTVTGLLTASGLLGLGGLLRFLGYQSEPPPKGDFELGPAANFPLGSRTILADIPAVLLHTDSGFSALSLVCTHLGCTVEQKTDRFACPCHGSEYASDGHVLRGPAAKPLAALRIEVTADEKLILHKA